MRRQLHRNAFALSAPQPSKALDNWSLGGLTAIGIVVNPKTCEPALVVTDGEYVSLRGLKASEPLQRLGRGYYEGSSNEPSRLTGYPRSHTPDGVLVKGKGWGTALYTALTLGASQAFLENVEIDMYEPGEGICSWTDNRSAEADKWWEAAVKIGLADQKVEEESETDENVNLDLEPSDLDRFVSEGQVVYVNKVSVDIEKTSEKTVELYTYEEASVRRELACVAMSVPIPKGISAGDSLGFLWRAIQEDSDLVSEARHNGLLALDVRGLTPDAIHLLSICFGESGLDDAACDEMYLRYERSLDPKMSSGQGRLFTANAAGLTDVEDAREAVGWADLADLP